MESFSHFKSNVLVNAAAFFSFFTATEKKEVTPASSFSVCVFFFPPFVVYGCSFVRGVVSGGEGVQRKVVGKAIAARFSCTYSEEFPGMCSCLSLLVLKR